MVQKFGQLVLEMAIQYFLLPVVRAMHITYLRKFDSLSTTNTLVYFDAFGRGKSDTAKNVTEYSLQRDIDDLEQITKGNGIF